MEIHNTITDVNGLRVGHAQDEEALTGCTVILCEAGATPGVDQRGGAPGTRQIDALHPLRLVQQVHAVVLAGGSAFGLDAASGVVRYLEERGVGFDVGVARVPIVPAAILFDLGIGRSDVRPNATMGYQACLNASSAPPAEGNVGAGTGATSGKILGMAQAMKTGIGSASMAIPIPSGRAAAGNSDLLVVAAIAAVNPFGDIIDPTSGQIIAGTRTPAADPDGDSPFFADTLSIMRARLGQPPPGFVNATNTVIGVVATNARLNKEQANKMAQMAHDGLARTICPAHTMVDGDTIFALATGTLDTPAPVDISTIGACAAEVFAQAVLRGVRAAQPAGGLPSWSSLER